MIYWQEPTSSPSVCASSVRLRFTTLISCGVTPRFWSNQQHTIISPIQTYIQSLYRIHLYWFESCTVDPHGVKITKEIHRKDTFWWIRATSCGRPQMTRMEKNMWTLRSMRSSPLFHVATDIHFNVPLYEYQTETWTCFAIHHSELIVSIFCQCKLLRELFWNCSEINGGWWLSGRQEMVFLVSKRFALCKGWYRFWRLIPLFSDRSYVLFIDRYSVPLTIFMWKCEHIKHFMLRGYESSEIMGQKNLLRIWILQGLMLP